MNQDMHQKVKATHLKRNAYPTSGNQRCARCSRIVKALNANTLCAKRPSHWAGPRIASSSLTAILDSQELLPSTVRAFNGWLLRSAWDEPESYWG